MRLRLPRLVLPIAAVTILTCAVFVRALAIEYTGVQPAALSAVWRRQGYDTIKADRVISEMVARAKLDHFLAPIQGLRGHIEFEEARGRGDDVYLLFRPNNVSDCLILYRGRRQDGKLLSKMVLGFDA